MKILVVSSYLPYPLFSGGQVRLYNLLKELSARHEITLVCEMRSHQSKEDIKELEKICKHVITVPRKKQWSMSNVVKSASSHNSFLSTGHTLSEMKKKLAEIMAQEKFDVIHVETFYVMQNLPQTSLPIVLVEHNIEYTVYEKFRNRAPAPFRSLLAMDIRKIKAEEEMFWHEASALVAVSNEDKRVMEKEGRHPFLVSNGVNTDQFFYKNIKKSFAQKEKRILFIGDFTWIQNQDTVKFIINEVWPQIKKQLQNVIPNEVKNPTGAKRSLANAQDDIKLWIVGRNIPDSIRGLSNDHDVLFDQESSAKPTEKIFQEAAVLLAPIRVGGGTSYKILESMSCGTPVVTMNLSANALEANDQQDIMVGGTPEELASKTLDLLINESIYKKISKNGRTLIENNYTWKEIAKKLEAVYESVK
ncbi:MAG: glycosyltransferase family 4 protein [Candidatus Levyibacteriota bacterium]